MKKGIKLIVGAVGLAAIVYFAIGGGKEKYIASEMQSVENTVAADAVKQYEIAKRGGDKMDTYVHAGLVAAAYLQAKDDANYQKWKAVEKQAGKDAGMPE